MREREPLPPGREEGAHRKLSVAQAGAGRQFEFREWTPDNHLRHSQLVALRDDKKARDVKREVEKGL